MAAADPAMLMRVMEIREQIEAARVRLSELFSLQFSNYDFQVLRRRTPQ